MLIHAHAAVVRAPQHPSLPLPLPLTPSIKPHYHIAAHHPLPPPSRSPHIVLLASPYLNPGPITLCLHDRGLSVLMVDADVFFRSTGLASMVSFIADRHREYDFLVTDNGFARPESYDDLNWGVAWLGKSSIATGLIDCLLHTWDSPVFSGVNYSTRREINHPYWRRSQPRVNHLLEVAITGRAVSAPRVCTFPRNLVRNAWAHLSGYPSVFHKLACARVDGLTNAPAYRPGAPARRLLSYSVPSDASPHEQRDALGRAFYLAARSNRTLVLPQAFFHGKRYDFCRLYDISLTLGTDPMDTRFMSRQEASAQGRCLRERATTPPPPPYDRGVQRCPTVFVTF
jgi:hypothetical protein